MEQPSSTTGAGVRKPVPTRPCEGCGVATSEHTLALVTGKYLCPRCAAAANDTSGHRRTLIAAAIGVALMLVIAGIWWLSNAHLAEKGQIGASLVRLQAAALTATPETALLPYLDSAATYNDLYAAAAAAGNPDPDTAAQAMWRGVITTAIQGGTMTSLHGDRAVMRREINKRRGDTLVPFVVEFEMRRTVGDTWKVTRILNADEVYATYTASTPER